MKPHFVMLIVVTGLATTLSSPPASAQQIAGGTVVLDGPGPQGEWGDIEVPHLFVSGFSEFVNEGLDSFSKHCRDAASLIGRKSKEAKDYLLSSGGYRVAGRWAENGLNFLKVVDFVTPMSQAAGFIYERDMTGTVHLLVNEVSSRAFKGVAGAGGSFFGLVGSVSGSVAGDELHRATIGEFLKGNEERVRRIEVEQRLGKPWLVPQHFLRSDGRVVMLSSDRYYDREARFPRWRTRTPEEQQVYENDLRRQWLDSKRLAEIERQALAGQITPEQFTQLLSSYRQRDQAGPWEPPPLDSGPDQALAQEPALAREPDQTQESDQARMPQPVTEPGSVQVHSPYADLTGVTPQTVTAVGQDEMKLGGFKGGHVATTKLTLKFWNIGSLVAGYGKASMKGVTSFSHVKTVETMTCEGTFSGGPNGTFVIYCEDNAAKMKMTDGRTISGSGTTLTVQNPEAFANWPQ